MAGRHAHLRDRATVIHEISGLGAFDAVEFNSFDFVRVDGGVCPLLGKAESEISNGNYHDHNDDKAKWL